MRDEDLYRRRTNRLAVAAGVILVLFGLAIVGFFVLLYVGLSSWGSAK